MKKTLSIVFLILFSINLKAQKTIPSAFAEGVQLLENREYKKAEKEFTFVIKKVKNQDNLKNAYINLGLALNGQGKYEKAITKFNKAIEIAPNDVTSFIEKGKTYCYLKNYELAIKDFEKVLSIDIISNHAADAYYYTGRIKSLQYQFEEAITYYTKYITLAPNDSEGYFLRATAKGNLLDPEGAIKDYDKAIELRPDFMEALANRGFEKINKLPVEEKINSKCLEEPCKDLIRAKQLGDKTVDDMIFIYCLKCK